MLPVSGPETAAHTRSKTSACKCDHVHLCYWVPKVDDMHRSTRYPPEKDGTYIGTAAGVGAHLVRVLAARERLPVSPSLGLGDGRVAQQPPAVVDAGQPFLGTHTGGVRWKKSLGCASVPAGTNGMPVSQEQQQKRLSQQTNRANTCPGHCVRPCARTHTHKWANTRERERTHCEPECPPPWVLGPGHD